MLVEMGIMDALVAKQGTVVTAGQLAKTTGFDELLISRFT